MNFPKPTNPPQAYEMNANSSQKCECDSEVNLSIWSSDELRKEKETIKCSDLFLSDSKDGRSPFHLEDEVVIIVAEANKIRGCTACRELFIKRLGMPRFWWEETYKRMNGYFGSESTRNKRGIIDSYSTWSRALVKQFIELPRVEEDSDIYYQWLKYNIFTRWMAPGKMMILIFDPVESIQERLSTILLRQLNKEELGNPYWPYARIFEDLVSLQGTAVWGLRDFIRMTELSPTRDHRNLREKPKNNYSRLHDIARHAIHVSETLDLSVKLSKSVIQGHEQFLGLEPGYEHIKSQIFKGVADNIRSRLEFFSHALSSLRCRSTSNQQRLNNEIQLRFHNDSQYDSQATVEINHSTQSDSASMRWISVVSLIFLPANLVSSIFSTTFFEVADGKVAVTKDFWIYWVVLIVATVGTMIFWFCLPRLAPGEIKTGCNSSTASRKTELSPRSSTHTPKREELELKLSTAAEHNAMWN